MMSHTRARLPILAATATVLALLFTSLQGAPPARAADTFDDVRAKWELLLTGGASLNTSDTVIASRIAAVGATASSTAGSMISSPTTTLWSDLVPATNYNDLVTTYNRLRDMTLGWATVGTSTYHSTALMTSIKGGLDWMHTKYYNTTTAKPSAWWWQLQIGVPLALTDITVLSYSQLTSAQVSNYMAAIAYQTPSSYSDTGANQVWRATLKALRGVLLKDSALVTQGASEASRVLPYVAGGEGGFFLDGGYVQHTKFSYLGGYGVNLLDTFSRLYFTLQDSTWAFSGPQLPNVYRWIYDTVEPLMWRGAVFDMTRGRNISRDSDEHVAGHIIMQSIVLLSQYAPAADAVAFRSMVKTWITADTFRDYFIDAPLHVITLSRAIMADATVPVRPALSVNKQFPSIAQAVHQRPGWAFGIAMTSNRMANFETNGSENKRGWFTADGQTFLYNSDLGQFSGAYQPTIDPYRRPGTTTDTTFVRGPGSNETQVTTKNWVGGTSLQGLYGATGMDFAAVASSLVAKKSWFTFDDAVVALGAGITSTDAGRQIETTVENRKITTSTVLTVDDAAKPTTVPWTQDSTGVQWAQITGATAGSDIGYYFPGGQDLTLTRKTNTGAWADINSAGQSSAPLSATYLTISVKHGEAPTNGAYSYALLPGKTASQTKAFAANPTYVVLANDTTVQAVKSTASNVVGANFWTDTPTWVKVGGTNFVSSTKKASVMTRETATGISVSLSDPTQVNGGTIEVEIARAAFGIGSVDPRITVTQLSPTIKLSARVNGTAGTPLEASFSYAGGAPFDTNLILGRSPLSQSSVVASPVWGVANLTDGDRESTPVSMGWSSSSSTGSPHSENVVYDLGATSTFNTVDLFAGRWGSEASFPGGVTVEASATNGPWTGTGVVSATTTATATGSRTTFPSVDARYIRLTFSSLSPNPYDSNLYRAQLAEIEVRNANIAYGASVTTSTPPYGGSGWGANRVTDGLRGSLPSSYGWSSNSSLTSDHVEAITINWGSSKTFSSIDLSPVIHNGQHGFPSELMIEVSPDGTSGWTTILGPTAYAVPEGTQHVTFTPVAGAAIRITGTHLRPNPLDSNLYRMQFSEVEVH